MMTSPFHVALVEPRIPQNTGSIARTCAATETPLHIVGKPLFEISDRTVRRAGLDYWPHVNLTMHDSITTFHETVRPKRSWYLSTKGKTDIWQTSFKTGDALIFGNESFGLGAEFLATLDPASIITIPMTCAEVRSLNLSNAVSVVLYEALRQIRT